MNWIVWALIILAVNLVVFTWIVAWIIYSALLRRRKPEKWARRQSMPDDEEYIRLYDQALSWREEHLSRKRDVEITNDGLRLVGEYYDFGSDRAVIIIPGRMESCYYSCHYAEPYRKAGFNVLTIDGRAHGESEGKINSLGYLEYRDVLAWARMLHDRENIRQVVLHGICIGSSTAVFAAADEACPDYVTAIVADGLYQRFYDSCRNHMINDHRPLFPFLAETMFLIRVVSKADAVHDGPIFRIGRVTRPVLFLHSRADIFSTPDKAQELYDRCPSEKKKIVWFDGAGHSRIRITHPEAYDQAILDYFSQLAN